MALPTEHNPAAFDPAVLCWDWEKTKTINQHPGLSSFQGSAAWDNKYFTQPEKPRAGTLKRSSVIFGDETPQLASSDVPKGDKSETYNWSCITPRSNFKLDPPESLYSEAQRKAVEDIGNQFMRTLEKLDDDNLEEPVDFNPILERHWTKLAEFYSAQVYKAQKLEQKLKAVPSSPGSLSLGSPPQLPQYLMSYLNDLKLRPFNFTKSEKKPGLNPYLKSEESKPPAKEGCTAERLREKTGEKDRITLDGRSFKADKEKMLDGIYETPKLGFEYHEKVGSVIGSQTELYSSATEGVAKINNLTEHGKLTGLVVAGMTTTSQINHNNVPNHLQEHKEKNNHGLDDAKQTEDQGSEETVDASIIYPMTDYLIENYYKTLAEAMKLAAMDPDNFDEVYTETEPNTYLVESTADGTEKTKDCSEKKSYRQFDTSSITTPDSLNSEGVADGHIDLMGDTADSDSEVAHKPNPVNTSNKSPKPFVGSGVVLETSDLSKTGPLIDTPYDTMASTPEEATFGEAETKLLSLGHLMMPTQDQISLPHGSSNDSFSVSDDSYLFCDSTKGELVKLQMEVEDHLEQAKKKGGLLVARWIDESGVKREKRVEVDDLENNKVIKKEGINNNDDDESEGEDKSDGDGVGEDELIEVFEFEYPGEGEDDEHEDDEEMEKLLAWIALEDAKGEKNMKLKDKDFSSIIIDSNKAQITEIMDAINSDKGSTSEQGGIEAAMRTIVEKELSVVDEEDDEEEDDNEKLGDKKDIEMEREDEEKDNYEDNEIKGRNGDSIMRFKEECMEKGAGIKKKSKRK